MAKYEINITCYGIGYATSCCLVDKKITTKKRNKIKEEITFQFLIEYLNSKSNPYIYFEIDPIKNGFKIVLNKEKIVLITVKKISIFRYILIPATKFCLFNDDCTYMKYITHPNNELRDFIKNYLLDS